MRFLDKRQIEYSPLIEKFLKEIKDVNPNGIPEPHLPVIGENYFSSKTKIAFLRHGDQRMGMAERFYLKIQ